MPVSASTASPGGVPDPGTTTASPPAGDAGTSAAPSWSDLAPDDAIARAPSTAVEVRLATTNGRSWISAKSPSGKVLFEGLLEDGEEKIVRDDEQVDLVAGNAGALSLTVNGEELGAPGGDGEVVRISFGPEATDGSSA